MSEARTWSIDFDQNSWRKDFRHEYQMSLIHTMVILNSAWILWPLISPIRCLGLVPTIPLRSGVWQLLFAPIILVLKSVFETSLSDRKLINKYIGITFRFYLGSRLPSCSLSIQTSSFHHIIFTIMRHTRLSHPKRSKDYCSKKVMLLLKRGDLKEGNY
jgi:hypothetical protein